MPFGDDWYGEGNKEKEKNVTFYDYGYSKWDIIPGTPSRGAGKDGYKPGTPAKNPINRYDFSDEERASFNKLRKWGEGPVLAAAGKLDITEVDDLETLNLLNDWLVENYGDLFDTEEEEEEEREPFIPTVYEPKELDIGEYSATPLTSKVNARMRIGGQPRQANKMKITGNQRN